MESIPLFPLGSVLLPGARIALQIFEPRYVDLVSECLKTDSGFGVLLLRRGSEVLQNDDGDDTRLAQLGTYAKIVDWNALPNGLLGITVEGQRKFRLLSSHLDANKLHRAEVEWLDDEPLISLPAHSVELKNLLQQLNRHPQVARLNMRVDIDDASTLGCVLSQLLPIEESLKFTLLAENDPLARLEKLMILLDDMS